MSLKHKEAFLVKCWGNEIIEGIAIELQIDDYGVVKCYLFSINNGESFTIHKEYSSDKVFFSIKEANNHLADEKNKALKYYKKELESYKLKIKQYES